MLNSYSVIVPVLNKQREIEATLQSISGSMAYFDENYPNAETVRGEVIVVDDGSTDGTAGLIHKLSQSNPRLRMIQHQRSFGIGAARNSGARVSNGDVLFFCDADDLYLREHVFAGFWLLDCSAESGCATGEARHVRLGDRGHLISRGDRRFAAVRTRVRLKETIHPYWEAAISNTIAQNLCLRRECHDWGEGFPEDFVYKRIGGCEDGAYNRWLGTFFRVGYIAMETVEYLRYPGNSFDVQMKRFTHAPGSEYDSASPEQQAVHNIRLQREEQRIGYLLDKWFVLSPPPLPADLLNWEAIFRELIRRDRKTDAEILAQQAQSQSRPLPAVLQEEIRTMKSGSRV